MSHNMFPHYQTLRSGTEGEPGKANRSIPDRINEYGLMDVVLDKSVLDIGCNRGYFGVCLAPYVKSYLGIDTDKNQLQFGEYLIRKSGLKHTILLNEQFKLRSDKFDVILCLSFHIYVGIPMIQFGEHLVHMLKPEGHLFLEGHPPGYHLPNVNLNEPESYWNPLTVHLKSQLTVVEEKTVKDRELTRPFIHFKKCG